MDNQPDESRFREKGLKLLVSDSGRAVVIVDKLWKDFGKFPRKDQASLTKWMAIWCAGEHQLPAERFKMLDRIGEYRIDEFKSYQARAYGTVATNWGNQTFVITALAIKKTDDADSAVIKRAGRIAAELELER
jgi:hypothetical protein